MTITTFNKKLALITYNQPWNTPIPYSFNGLNRGDKQHLLWGYPGIIWGGVVLGTILDSSIMSITSVRTFTSITPTRTIETK